jgi:sigma-B regulation protein RsbQ
MEMLMLATRRNNVNVLGNGEQTLMFAHGYGCDQNMWRHVVPEFTKDFKVVLFDYVGSGASDASAFDQSRYSTLRGYGQDVLDIIQELGLSKVHFVGHSVSSMIGALAAIQQPEAFASVTMIGPSPCYINSGEYTGGMERGDVESLLETLESNHVAWSATMAPVIMGNPESPELADELEASFCRMDPFLANHFARVTFLSDNRADLPKLITKTLILQCQKDAIAGTSVGKYVHECLPNSQFVFMNATGHCPHMSAPKEVVKALQSFLN